MSLPSKTFGEISELRNGVNFVVADQGAATKVVGVGDFQARTEISKYDDLAEIRLKGELSPDDELRDGDLLFVRSNGNKNLVGRCLVIRNPPSGVTFSGFTIRARLNKSEVLPDYIALIFQGGALNRQMTLAGGGNGNISNLNQSLLATMPLTLPSINDQRGVVTCLSTWNSAIQKTEQLIAAKELLQCGLMQKLVIGRSYPEHRLAEFVHRVSRKNMTGDDHPLTISGRDGLISQLHYFDKRIAAEATAHYTRLKRGEFAYNRSYSAGYPCGAIKRLDAHEEGIVSALYLCFALNPDAGLLSDYLVHFCEAGGFNHQIRKVAREGARNHGLLNVAADDFFALTLPLPPIEEQVRVVAILGGADRELALLRASLDQLRRQKRGLMQKLLTGQWRVKVPESEAA